MTSGPNSDSVTQHIVVIVITHDEAGLMSGFRGLLAPAVDGHSFVTVPNLPHAQLATITSSEVVIIPGPTTPIQLVQAISAEAAVVDGADIATTMFKLTHCVAEVDRVEATTGEQFRQKVLEPHGGDLFAGLHAETEPKLLATVSSPTTNTYAVIAPDRLSSTNKPFVRLIPMGNGHEADIWVCQANGKCQRI